MEILLRVNYEQRVATRHDGKVISVVLSHIVVRMFMRHGEGFMHKEQENLIHQGGPEKIEWAE